jgi:hypothetical protein
MNRGQREIWSAPALTALWIILPNDPKRRRAALAAALQILS